MVLFKKATLRLCIWQLFETRDLNKCVNSRGKNVWCEAEQKCGSIRQMSGVQYKGRKVNNDILKAYCNRAKLKEGGKKVVKNPPKLTIYFFLTRISWNIVELHIFSLSVQMGKLLKEARAAS